MRRLQPLAVLAIVTLLELGYGRFGWSWLAGPVAAGVVYALDRASRASSEPAPAHLAEPAPVD